MIEAKIIADSINPVGNRISTFILTYPRFIHAQLMTHRVFSRNVASSRAIPIKTIIERITQEPAMPVFWGKNQKGMQASEELNEAERSKAIKLWCNSAKRAIKYANNLLKLGVHKQITNRILEPYMHVTTLVTATEFGNFFNLRVHEDAQPEFQCLASRMLEAYSNSSPAIKKPGEWHLPFADQFVHEGLSVEQLLKIVTARAARISYLNFEGNIDHEKDYLLHDSLAASGHWSPFEHAAKALHWPAQYANFIGWKPYRKFFMNENRNEFHSNELLRGVERWILKER